MSDVDQINSNFEIDSTKPKKLNISTAPTYPVLSSNFFRGGKADVASLLDVNDKVYVTSARIAIALALKTQGIGSGDEVLLPAYHCGSMVTPVDWSGAKAVFYRIHPDMSVDLKDIELKLGSDTRALLVPHYFGFTQPLRQIRDLCDRNRILLIEDCAHTFFGAVEGKDIGVYGDYAVGSIVKFFPVTDGGCLVSSRHSLKQIRLKSAGVLFEIKAALNTLEEAFQYHRLPFCRAMFRPFLFLKDYLWARVKSGRTSSPDEEGSSALTTDDRGFDFDPEWINRRISISSLSITKWTSTFRSIKKRRENYLWFLDAFKTVPNCRPLDTVLSEDTAPYMFPLILDNPDPAYWELRQKGLPLQRWEFLSDQVDNSVCPTSTYYSRHLIQIPCHQELEQQELEWIVDNVRNAIA